MVFLLIVIMLTLVFGFVVLFGAPYLPTTRRQIETALDLLELSEGQTMLELGSGDGRVLKAAARRGWNAVGYELNPLLVLISRLHTWRYRSQVRIIYGNFWRQDWPESDGIFVFLLDRYMKKLDKKVTQEFKGSEARLVSFAFEIPGKRIVKTRHGIHLYLYK